MRRLLRGALVIPLLVSLSHTLEAAEGNNTHYIVFDIDDNGTFRPLSAMEVRLTKPRPTKSREQISAVLARASREDVVVATLYDVYGREVYLEAYKVDRHYRAEWTTAGGQLEGALIPAPRAFVARVPIALGSRLSLELGSSGAVQWFEPSALVADTSLPLASLTATAAPALVSSPSLNNKINVLTLAEGYTLINQNKFNTDYDSLIPNITTGLRTIAPFNKYWSYFDARKQFFASAQAGADRPTQDSACTVPGQCCQNNPYGTYFATTKFDAYYCADVEIFRFITSSFEKAATEAASVYPDWDIIVVLVNENSMQYSGASAGHNFVTITSNLQAATLAHELGHSIGQLGDEYLDEFLSGFCTDTPPATSCPSNITDQISRPLIKWNPWILPSTPIPSDGVGDEIVGLFQGALFNANLYRPELNCRMRDSFAQFCKVCMQSMILGFYDEGNFGVSNFTNSDPPDGETQFVSLPGSKTFSAATQGPTSPGLFLKWYVNGARVVSKSATEFIFNPPPDPEESYQVQLVGYDTTPAVHPDMFGPEFIKNLNWSVEINSSGGTGNSVSSISPTSGLATAGQNVTIRGTGFVTGDTVTIGNGAATNVVVVNSTTITAKTPLLTKGTLNKVVVQHGSVIGELSDGYFANYGDVSGGSFHPDIVKISKFGVTAGCGSGNYCPTSPTTRAQMAPFLLKASLGQSYTPSPATGTVFSDVLTSHPQAAWIEQLAAYGITAGCGGGQYCPNNSVTRGQMAVFLLKTKYGWSYVPPPAVGLFQDVPVSSPNAPWIEDLYNQTIAVGCGGGNFCPNQATTRQQMATFLEKTFF